VPFDETRENVLIELLRCGDGVGSSRALPGGGATARGRCPGLTSFPSGGSRRDSPVSAASAARFRAALWSRSRTRPHVRHTYVRCERVSLPFAVPHPEQVFELQKVAIGHRQGRPCTAGVSLQAGTRPGSREPRSTSRISGIVGMVTNRRSARVISDAGWGGFVRLLEEKTERCGRIVATVSRWSLSSKDLLGLWASGHVMDATALDGPRMVLSRLWCPARSGPQAPPGTSSPQGVRRGETPVEPVSVLPLRRQSVTKQEAPQTRHNRGGNPRPSRRGARQEPSKAKKRRPPSTMDVYGCHEGGRAHQAPPSGRRNPIAGVAGHKMNRDCTRAWPSLRLPHQGPLAAARRNMTR
jgi:hypothetical protein